MIWNWYPGLGLGPFKLNDDINKYVSTYNLTKELEEVDVTGWITYNVPNRDISLDVEDSLIVSICSYDYFCFKNKNLIGMKIKTFVELLSIFSYEIGESVEYDDVDIQTAYEYDELGLQVWESQGVIVGAACREI